MAKEAEIRTEWQNRDYGRKTEIRIEWQNKDNDSKWKGPDGE